MVIISASGMCEGGRIVHHLRNNIADPRNIILIVGYQAENTLGRKIVERPPTVSIFGEELPLNARVHTINALSAHADRGGLMRWFDSSKDKDAKRVLAVHGDEEQTLAMVDLLKRHGARSAIAPVPGQKEVLDD
jgi:metallo-beta-lactamase family protein